MKKIFFKKKYPAFSLIELMVVVSVIGIMSVAAVVSFQGSQTNSRLQAAQREVASAIKLAQSYALEGKTQDDGSGPKAPCGYGVHFASTTSYEIYYNMDADCQTFTAPANRKYTGSSGFFLPVNLNNGVVLSSPNPNQTDVYFTVPYANIFWRGGNFGPSNTLQLTYAGITKNLVITAPSGIITETN